MIKPVIIDTDPGIDDALALFLAFSSNKLDIRAITTVAGNQTIEKTTKNALDIVDYIGKNVKITKGANKPLCKELVTAEWVHGETGLCSVVLPPSKLHLEEKKAWDIIYEEAIKAEGKLNVIALGPLTNIAITLIKYPEIKDKIQRITLMGGACYGGNSTPVAEFNIYTDVEAADTVFKSGVPITMVGLDATKNAIVYKDEVDKICTMENNLSSIIKKLFYESLRVCKTFNLEGAVMHDALAVAAVIEEDIIERLKYYVAIETKGTFTRGKTVVDVDKVTKVKANAEVAFSVKRDKFLKLLKDMMNSYNNN
ncbi:nucleoside hydrolase [Clostridium rectalis]|uniref:nucleoside hydrolase n=1 Tax=Clostridium rectalis TaxID=2040295 RepID=UPI000F630251|nr:nucleoside hydrolase [Clostridium rectalis]